MAVTITDEIKNKINIVDVVSQYIDLQKKGKNHWGVCPFHEDTNPSMSVSPEKQMFKCFVCGHGGNAINFVADFEKISYGKALEKLASQVGIEFKNTYDMQAKYTEQQQLLIDVLKDAINYFEYSLASEEGKDAYEYTKSRNIDTKTKERFPIGYAPTGGLIKFLKTKGHEESTIINASLMNAGNKEFFQDRLIFGIKNQYGDVVALSGRLLKGDGPKYINSIESQIFKKSSILYNYSNAKDMIRREKEVYILEGFMDVIAMDKAGFRNSVAIMGTALTKDHLKLLKNIKVTLMLDSDAAGVNAALKSIALLIYNNIPNYVIYNKDQKDADEILSKSGPEGLKNIVNQKISGLQFVYAILKNKHDTNTPDGLNNFVVEMGNYLANTNTLEKQFYVNKMSQEFKIPQEVISSRIPGHTLRNVSLENPNDKSIKVNEQTLDIKYPKINYSYVLIKAMLEKPFLIEILKDNPATFDDAMLLGIVKYIVDIKDKSTNKTEFKRIPEFDNKIKEILNYRWEEIASKENFLDLIEILNKKSIDARDALLSVKLNSTNSQSEKEELLIKKWKLKKERNQ